MKVVLNLRLTTFNCHSVLSAYYSKIILFSVWHVSSSLRLVKLRWKYGNKCIKSFMEIFFYKSLGRHICPPQITCKSPGENRTQHATPTRNEHIFKTTSFVYGKICKFHIGCKLEGTFLTCWSAGKNISTEDY